MVKQKKPVDVLDVRSPNDVPAFEDMIQAGPITVVLVYADWCGHCVNYKKNVWKNLTAMGNRKVNLASVHFDQLANTSQKDAKIEGYPSVLIVGNDKKAADFKKEDGQKTNALPNANNLEAMKTLVSADAKTIVGEMTAPELKEDMIATEKKMVGGSRNRTAKKKQSGGSLLQSLISITKDLGHIALLTGVAASVAKKGKSRKRETQKGGRRRRMTRKN